MGMVSAVILGIDAFWWWALFIRREPHPEPLAGVADAGALKSPAALREALATHGGDPAAVDRTARSGRWALAEFKFWQTCVVLAVIGGFWLFTGGDLEHGVGPNEIVIWAAIVLLPTLVLVVRLATGLADKGIASANAEAAALGLRTVDVGAMAGSRHGREVEVTLDGRDSTVVVHGAVPSFEVGESAGKLAASDGAPAAVAAAVRSLRKAKRWRGIALRAGDAGVTIERHGAVNDGWLYDLWLGEKLLEELAAVAD